jgi:Tol biopolymer transport system component
MRTSHRGQSNPRSVGAAFVLTGLLVWACPQPARAQGVTVTQVTNTTGGLNLAPSVSGTLVAFRSDRNLINSGGCPALPGNADGNPEIYLFDFASGCYTQVTNTGPGIANVAPSLDGTRLAFQSNGNLANPGGCPALPGNADGNFEIYLFDLTTGCFTQVTNTTGPGFGSFVPSLSGTRVAFESVNDIANPGGCPALPGNADGNFEIYLFDLTTGCFTQVTNTTGGGNDAPSLSGTRVAFQSRSNLTNPGGCPALPGNADGSQEIYLFDITSGCYVQVTNTTGGTNNTPSLSGTRVAFTSVHNLVNPGGCPGLPGNADGNAEIYLFDLTTGCYTQVTNTTGGSGGANSAPSLSGARVAFQSVVNLANSGACPALPGNTNGNYEIYLFDLTTGCYTQITNSAGGIFNEHPSLSPDGSRIGFESNDTTPCTGCPGNPDGNVEIFVASLAPTAAATVPTLSEWAQLAMVALLVLGALLALRRRAVRLDP